ncbi:CYTH domain-containing protein [Streptomyces gramineus]|uniref:CYTH domain-containing protein n=1 Tax=Streptomyces gramineus TaxID=910542 RepID=UPI00398A977B
MDQGTEELDAVYYDTDDLRLIGASATLRRRTGGDDASWHLKPPLAGDSREEEQAPLSDTLPDALCHLALPRTGERKCARSSRLDHARRTAARRLW